MAQNYISFSFHFIQAMEVLMTMVAIIIMAMETMALMTGCEMEEVNRALSC
jgi:hypothetical protein